MKQKLSLLHTLLKKRSARRKEKLFVVEGPHLVEEAVDQIKFVVYSENLPLVRKLEGQGIECLKISRKQFADLSDVETPQGILAVVKQQEHDLQSVLKVKNPLVVFCVEIQDPGNLGTIIRTADAVSASGVILSKGTVDPYNQKVIRASMGSLFHLPIVQADDVFKTIKQLKEKNIQIVVTDISSKKDFFAIEYRKPCAILVGNEGSGLPKEIVGLADRSVKIPMPGKAESLNVGVSTAVILYEALRQRTYGRQG